MAVVLCALAAVPANAHAAIKWFKFSRAFIASHYQQGEAFGTITSTEWTRASSVHGTTCGGDDGELHIGAKETKLQLAAGESPLSGSGQGSDPKWGLVAELPNAAQGQGPTKFNSVAAKTVTFEGYFRVWNEGYDVGSSADSNPDHVFEVHPAWGFSSGTTQFSNPGLIKTIPSYAGYGATKFKPVLKAIKAHDWPLAYQDGPFLRVALGKAENFYQLPVKVKSVQTITGGHEVMVDVFSDKAFSKLVYSDLKCVTVQGSPLDDAAGTVLTSGAKLFLLGFFNVNLAEAATISQGATTQATAVPVAEAVEFLVFGKAGRSAVASCL